MSSVLCFHQTVTSSDWEFSKLHVHCFFIHAFKEFTHHIVVLVKYIIVKTMNRCYFGQSTRGLLGQKLNINWHLTK
jgi:hypothetical protein